MDPIPVTRHPFQRSRQFLGTVVLHDQRDQKHVLGCPKCQGIPMSPDSPQQYTVPFWEAYDKEQEKWK